MHATGEHFLWLLGGILIGFLAAVLIRARKPRAMPRPLPSATPVPEPTMAAGPAATFHEPPSALVIDVAAARAAGFNMKHADDLTVILGIGPRTVELLRVNGVDSLARMAQLAPDAVRAILDHGGPAFALADPSTWTEQAALASANRWQELRQRQQALLRARPPTGPDVRGPDHAGT